MRRLKLTVTALLALTAVAGFLLYRRQPSPGASPR
jgi:hypothetical protein